MVVGNCCDNCFQVRVYYVEYVYVERPIEHQELEGQIEMDWEKQVVVALLGSQIHFAEINIPNQGPGLLCVMCQLVVVIWRPPCLFCLVGYNHQIYSNHFSFSCWIFVIFVSFELKFNHSNCPFQHIDLSGKAHSLNNTDIVTLHRSSLHCQLTHSAIFFLLFEEQCIEITLFDLGISEPDIK